MPLKVVLFYNQGQRGWTETWYSPSSDVPFTQLPAADIKIFTQAVAFRAPLTTLYAARYSDEQNPRRAVIWPFNGKYVSGLPSVDAPDVVSTDAVYGVTGEDFVKRRIFLRGLPDDGVKRKVSGVDDTTPGFSAGVDRYLQAVKDARWQIKVVTKPSAGGIHLLDVKLLEPDAVNPNFTKVTTVQNVVGQIALGFPCRFLRPPKGELAGFPRSSMVSASAPGTNFDFNIQYRWRGPATFAPQRMQVLAQIFTYKTMVDWFFERFSERKTGRGFGALRGRSRAVALAR